jgi:hypothetical protein
MLYDHSLCALSKKYHTMLALIIHSFIYSDIPYDENVKLHV